MRIQDGMTLDAVLAGIDPSPRPHLEETKRSLRATLAGIKAAVQPLSTTDLERARAAAVEWAQRRAELKRIIEDLIPPGSRVIVADADQLGDAFTSVDTIPFTERNGVYWGPPGTAEEAIKIDRQVDRGARWFVIAWPMFWMFDRYPALASQLRARSESHYDFTSAAVFHMAPGLRAPFEG